MAALILVSMRFDNDQHPLCGCRQYKGFVSSRKDGTIGPAIGLQACGGRMFRLLRMLRVEESGCFLASLFDEYAHLRV